MNDNRYEDMLARARDEGTDYLEREDLPEPDRYAAARDLARLLVEEGDDLHYLAEALGLPDVDPARWESLDTARAASYACEHHPEAFDDVAGAHPWLRDVARSNAHNAIGSLADQFLGHR